MSSKKAMAHRAREQARGYAWIEGRSTTAGVRAMVAHAVNVWGSQVAVAEMLGVHETTVSRWVHGAQLIGVAADYKLRMIVLGTRDGGPALRVQKQVLELVS